MGILMVVFMFLVVTGLISLDLSLKQKLKNDKIVIDKLNELIEKIK